MVQVYSSLIHILQGLGVGYSGATYKFTVLDTLGHRVAQQGESSVAKLYVQS